MNQQRLDFLEKLKAYWVKENIPNVSELNGQFLNFLIKSQGVKSMLEIGCANGYSTIWITDALEETWGKLISYDVSLPSFNEAKENLKEIWLDHLVDFRFWNILDKDLTPTEMFDFIFVDARKKYYLQFFEAVKPLMKKGCTVFFDDVVKFKHKMQSFYDYIENQKDYEWFVLPIDEDDWVLILRAKT